MSDLVLASVSKSYGSLVAASDVSMNIKHGESIVLLGPSGCGKTTVLRMIAGFVQPTSGRILVAGKDVTNLPPRKRNIGMVFQHYALFPTMTVAENIAFGLKQRAYSRSVIDARVNQLLDMIKLKDRGNHFCNELSGGQQQRVALARALAFTPQLLLMDEPLSALDRKLREEMQVELRRTLRELQITTVFVTHDQHEAMSLADRIVVMSEGRVQQVGTPEDLYSRPANRFVADFVGRNNILAGSVETMCDEGCYVRMPNGARVLILDRKLPTGSTVEIALRPESIRLNAEGHKFSESSIKGNVIEVQNLGNITYYFVSLSDDRIITVEYPGLDRASVSVGSPVELLFDPAKAHIIRDQTRGIQ